MGAASSVLNVGLESKARIRGRWAAGDGGKELRKAPATVGGCSGVGAGAVGLGLPGGANFLMEAYLQHQRGIPPAAAANSGVRSGPADTLSVLSPWYTSVLRGGGGSPTAPVLLPLPLPLLSYCRPSGSGLGATAGRALRRARVGPRTRVTAVTVRWSWGWRWGRRQRARAAGCHAAAAVGVVRAAAARCTAGGGHCKCGFRGGAGGCPQRGTGAAGIGGDGGAMWWQSYKRRHRGGRATPGTRGGLWGETGVPSLVRFFADPAAASGGGGGCGGGSRRSQRGGSRARGGGGGGRGEVWVGVLGPGRLGVCSRENTMVLRVPASGCHRQRVGHLGRGPGWGCTWRIVGRGASGGWPAAPTRAVWGGGLEPGADGVLRHLQRRPHGGRWVFAPAKDPWAAEPPIDRFHLGAVTYP